MTSPSCILSAGEDTGYAYDEYALHRAYRAKVTKHHEWLQAKNYWFVPVVAATTGELHPESLRLLYDFARLKTDAAEQHAVANSLRSPLTPEQLCQRRGATFARLRMEAQLYSLRAAATRLTGKHWAAPYASSLLPRFAHGPGVGLGLLPRLPPPTCSRPVSGVGLGPFCSAASCCGLPAPTRHQFFALRFATLVIKRICLSCRAHPSTTNLLDASARVLYMADGAANRVRVGLALLLLESHESEPRRIEPAKSNDLRCIGLPLTDRAPKKTTAAYDPPPPKTFTPSN